MSLSWLPCLLVRLCSLSLNWLQSLLVSWLQCLLVQYGAGWEPEKGPTKHTDTRLDTFTQAVHVLWNLWSDFLSLTERYSTWYCSLDLMPKELGFLLLNYFLQLDGGSWTDSHDELGREVCVFVCICMGYLFLVRSETESVIITYCHFWTAGLLDH